MPVLPRCGVLGVLLVSCAGPVHGGALPIDAPADSRRLLFEPCDVAFVEAAAGSGSRSDVPPVGTLGSADDAYVLLRFSVDLPPDAQVLQAYVLLERASGGEALSSEVDLGASRITERWSSASVAWADRPRFGPASGQTHVARAAGRLTRVDVRDLVTGWARRRRDEFGIAIHGAGGSHRGVAFALRAGPAAGASEQDDGGTYAGPRLELYVK
jgi:hypothetical protein